MCSLTDILTRVIRHTFGLGTTLIAIVLGTSIALPSNATESAQYEKRSWSFYGVLGTYDRASLQRGLQVYTEVCAACHGLKRVAFRNLLDLGFTEEEAKAIAASYDVSDGPNEEGDMYTRPGRLSDYFVSPFPNDNAARASNNGSLPPDLSLITKSRTGGPDYLYSLLIGYSDPPEGENLLEGMSYNSAFPGHQIAMPPPLISDAVTYTDGTNATIPQMSQDITQFLSWAAEGKLEERKRLGLKVMIFLIILTGLLYAVKRRVWSGLH